MKTRLEKKSLQFRTIQQQKQERFEGAYIEDNRDTAQMRLIDMIQRIGVEEEDEPLHGKFETIQQKSNSTGLPDSLKTGIEGMSGFSVDDVRVHYNSDKPAQMQAHAYAQGTDIHVAPGQEKHLPHEVWHVVQQKQGRVQPTMQLQGVSINDNQGLEMEADMMGIRAINHIHPYKTNLISKSSAQAAIQRKPTVWAADPNIGVILAIGHGWFSTWRKIKAKVVEYGALQDNALDLRRDKLDEIRPLMALWSNNPRHSAASKKQRVQNIRNNMQILETIVEDEYTEIAVDADNITGGHSEVRHGADLTDRQLQDRLTTGKDRDNKNAPADVSSRFASHDFLVGTRKKAFHDIDHAVANTKGHFKPSINQYVATYNAWNCLAGAARAQANPQYIAMAAAKAKVRAVANALVNPNTLLLPRVAVVNPNFGGLVKNVLNSPDAVRRIEAMVKMSLKYSAARNYGMDIGTSYKAGPAKGLHPRAVLDPQSPQWTLTIVSTNNQALDVVPPSSQWTLITHYPTMFQGANKISAL